MSRPAWPDGLSARLASLWADPALSASAIGERLGLTKNAVVGKARRLGLPPRPSPINRTDAPTPKVERPKPVFRPASHVVPIEETRARLAEAPAVPAIAFRHGRGACCWPIGEPRTPGFRYCEAPAVAGRPYCPAHARRAYTGCDAA